MIQNKKFKVGDKVSFLNEKGGGIITKIIDDQIVHVSIEEGFEIPTAVSDIIKTESSDPNEPALMMHRVIEEEADEDIKPLHISYNDKDQLAEGIYIMMVPEVEDAPLTGNLELLLVNHTSFKALFSLYLNESGEYFGEDYGFIDSESQLLLASIGRSEINSWANSLLQVVFFKEEKASPLKPVSSFINFKPVKIYQEESFKYEKLIRKKAFTINVEHVLGFQSTHPLTAENKNIAKAKSLQDEANTSVISEKKAKQEESFLEKHKIDERIAEVDLHIGELIDNFSNLSNIDIIKIQMDYFNKCMQQSEVENLYKVVFIHGVGNGVLRNEIHKYLRNTSGVEFHDASFSRYGMGATEVVFYKNK